MDDAIRRCNEQIENLRRLSAWARLDAESDRIQGQLDQNIAMPTLNVCDRP
ncbi:hypothetical protein MKK55_25255 [Methylobacterium sp. J-059]|uniref:hypothetical protein n=1 Tax=Methylobacterium sp. J-059 TaxID=2836643 RepID=UPI001FB9AFDF|nr:hypothetical protein [Methylobacterium sp. J-059]MCJ2042237.1 hypothetical protein [Methylobacterium sp. J-059]